MGGRRRAAALAAAIMLAHAGAVRAQPNAPTPAAESGADRAEIARLQKILDAQHPQFGDVTLPGPGATLHLGRRFYFLKADEAKQVLGEWGNPPAGAEGVLGMVFPAGATFVDDDAWGAVVTYEASGFVSDEDADKTDYAKLLADAQAGEADENASLKKEGYATAHLVGWAQPPTYDRSRHFLIWARDIRFSNQDVDALNYDVRVLGRRGVLSLNLVSNMPKLPRVRADAADLAAVVTFDRGEAYADFQEGRDKAAGYGVAGLVAAGLGVTAAQKFGLLAMLLVFAKKALVFIAAGLAVATGWVRRLFRRKAAAAKAAPPAGKEPEETV
jgi:uncharacterized membrane-anchored protein